MAGVEVSDAFVIFIIFWKIVINIQMGHNFRWISAKVLTTSPEYFQQFPT